MPQRKDVKCLVCEIIFGSSNRAIVCSYKCNSILKLKERVGKSETRLCSICSEIKPLIYKSYDKLVCSRRCVVNYNARVFRVKNNTANRYNLKFYKLNEQKKCIVCEAEFKTKNWQQRFCESKCRDKWRYINGKKEKQQLKREKNNLKIELETKECGLCKTKVENIKTKMELGIHKFSTSKLEKDHILPYSKGGSNVNENIRYICWFCNRSRINLDLMYDKVIAETGRVFWAEINKIPVYS